MGRAAFHPTPSFSPFLFEVSSIIWYRMTLFLAMNFIYLSTMLDC
uniref:Uncharacterized protein n=1 Tax=Rhizophora mucronata TaxID=61149 RepID=A0A2P2QM41_RHIMU